MLHSLGNGGSSKPSRTPKETGRSNRRVPTSEGAALRRQLVNEAINTSFAKLSAAEEDS